MDTLKAFLSIVFKARYFAILSTLYGVFVLIRDEFLPLEIAEKLRLGGIFKLIDWYWWVIVGLAVWALSIAWESAKYRNTNQPKLLEHIDSNKLKKDVSKPKVRQTTSPQETKKPDPIIQRFSLHLDRNIDELRKHPLFQITSNGLNFLRRIKNAPPFLGKDFPNRVIYPDEELKLTEYFQAVEFTETNMKSIKGGRTYTITDEDTTWKIVSKKHYGNIKFVNLLKTSNPMVHELETGMVIYIPYVDTSGTLGVLPPQYIENKYDKASLDWIQSTILGIVDNQMISGDEALPLLLAIFAAAQETLNEEKENRNEKET